MVKKLTSVLILSVICSVTLAEPGLHTLHIHFPGPNSDKNVLMKPLSAKQQPAPYAAAGFKPEPAFKLTYDPPANKYGPPEPAVFYVPPADTYGPPDQSYGPPDQTYGLPDLFYGPPGLDGIQQTTIVNEPLRLPPHSNKSVSFRPQLSAIVSVPLRPVGHLTLPRPQRGVAFRPKRRHNQSQLFLPTRLTLPYLNRLTEFRPRHIPNRQQQQQPDRFSRPLPSSIFGYSGRNGRPLPSNIFSK